MEINQDQDRGLWTSASSAEADSLCSGRHIAQRDLPDKKSEDASFGDAVHLALAKQDPAGLTTEQESVYEACNAITTKLLSEVFPSVIGEPMPPLREKRMWIQWADGLKHSAQLDFALIVGGRALIIEYKSLPGSLPSAPENMQLRDQVVILATNAPGLTEIVTAVVQPLVTHSPQICTYKQEHIQFSRDQLYHRCRASNTAGSPRVAGDVQCKFCKATATCAVYTKAASAMVVGTAPDVSKLSEHTIEAWTPEMKAAFLDRAGIAEKWIEESKDKIREMMKADPKCVPGYELKDGKNRSVITNPDRVFDAFSKVGGTLSQFMGCIKVSKTELKEAVKVAAKLKGKKLDDAVMGIIGSNVETTQDRPSITKIK